MHLRVCTSDRICKRRCQQAAIPEETENAEEFGAGFTKNIRTNFRIILR